MLCIPDSINTTNQSRTVDGWRVGCLYQRVEGPRGGVGGSGSVGGGSGGWNGGLGGRNGGPVGGGRVAEMDRWMKVSDSGSRHGTG